MLNHNWEQVCLDKSFIFNPVHKAIKSNLNIMRIFMNILIWLNRSDYMDEISDKNFSHLQEIFK